MVKKISARNVVRIMHLWVGIPCALFLFIMCLSGTIYVFNREITQWIDSDKFKIAPPVTSNPLPIATLMAIIENEKKGFKTTAILIPQNKMEAWSFSLQQIEKNKGSERLKKDQAPVVSFKEANAGKSAINKMQGEAGKMERKERPQTKFFLVNPYTGLIQGNAQTTTYKFFNTVMQLHRWLLISNHDIGGAITGFAAIMMIFLQISGLILWLPASIKSWKKRNAWKQGFKIKFNSSGKRLNFDLHKTIGFYAFFFITIMALTGPVLGFDWYRTGFTKLLGAKLVKRGAESELVSIKGTDATKAITAEIAIAKANELFNYPSITRINFPKNELGVFNVQKTKDGFFASAATDRVTLDQYSAGIIKLDRFDDKTLGQKIVSLAKPIHTGEMFGIFSKILYFIACLLATSLPVTGIIIWWGKRNKRKHI